jgi:hypothetical protein
VPYIDATAVQMAAGPFNSSDARLNKPSWRLKARTISRSRLAMDFSNKAATEPLHVVTGNAPPLALCRRAIITRDRRHHDTDQIE